LILSFWEAFIKQSFGAFSKFGAAPDPTAGASASEQTLCCLGENTIQENIWKIVIQFCVPVVAVVQDVVSVE
jgi:hypothetical protein